jgi:hypothetical protein
MYLTGPNSADAFDVLSSSIILKLRLLILSLILCLLKIIPSISEFNFIISLLADVISFLVLLALYQCSLDTKSSNLVSCLFLSSTKLSSLPFLVLMTSSYEIKLS